ncbi:MAG TPA: hypothetical protein VFU97_24520 [Xanthobacteraceae bacterium]|nr:hypothetical protein [Xanthobacteraceae bacterium]
MRQDDVGYSGAAVVSPNDSADLPRKPARALHVGASGTIVVDPADGKSSQVAIPVIAGETLRLQVKRVWSTGTTVSANSLVALYGPKVP